jgi:uncharacterized protein (DUF362 family)
MNFVEGRHIMSDIFINYGDDPFEMTGELLRASGAARLFASDMRVLIKPNLVVARPASGGATTHPEIIDAIIVFLQTCGVNDIVIAEGSWVGEKTSRAFKNCGYEALAKKHGIALVDTKKDEGREATAGDLRLMVCDSVFSSDFIINVPVLKGHCQTDLTCCLKNMKGLIPDGEKRRYHNMGLHKPIAALNTVIKPGLHIVDGICGDPTFEEGGNPVDAGRIMLGFDPLLLDSYCARLLGYEPDEIGYLKYAKDYGLGHYADERTTIAELNPEHRPAAAQPRSDLTKRLGRHIDEDGACSACYAALISALNKSGPPNDGARIKIGQGFRGKKAGGIGVGKCTAGCDRSLKGCPPSAADIVAFLREEV